MTYYLLHTVYIIHPSERYRHQHIPTPLDRQANLHQPNSHKEYMERGSDITLNELNCNDPTFRTLRIDNKPHMSDPNHPES